MNFQIDYESDYTLHNLVTHFDLTCESDLSISKSGLYYFLGVFFSLMIWIKATDSLGSRRPIIIMGAVMQMSAFAGLIISSSTNGLNTLYICYFILGLGTVTSTCTSYNLLIEYTPKHSKILLGTLFLAS